MLGGIVGEVLVVALTVTGALALVVCDLFHASHFPKFPLVPTLATALVATAGANFGIVGIAKRSHPKYKAYQAFRGGVAFLSVQILAFTTLAVALTGVVLYTHVFLNDPKWSRSGVLLTMGFLTATGTGLHRASVSLFVEADSSASLRTFGKSPNRETLLVAVLLMGTVTMASAATHAPHFATPLVGAILLVHLTCGALTHLYIGWRCTKGYRLFMPFSVGAKGAAAQLLGWGLFSATIYLAMFVFGHPMHESGSHASVVEQLATPMSVGLCSVVSCGSLLIFARSTNFGKPSGSASSLSRHGAFVLSALAVCLTLVIIFASVVESDALRMTRGAALWAGVSTVVMLMLPPLSHLIGSFSMATRGYNVWMPFRGPAGFIVAQAAGWAFYGVGIIAGVLHFSAHGTCDALRACAVALLMAQFCIHGSLKVFFRMGCTERACSPVLFGDGFVTGELVTAALLSLTSLVLCVACDFAVDDGDPGHRLVLAAALLAAFGATPLAHWSGRAHSATSLLPFHGTAEYAALQASGWTLFSISSLIGIVVCVDPDFISPSGDLRWTVSGIISQIPFVMIVASVYSLHKHHISPRPLTVAEEAVLTRIECLVKELNPLSIERRELDNVLAHLGKATQHPSAAIRNAASAARVTVFVLCTATAGLFIMAAFASTAAAASGDDRDLPTVLCVAGCALTTAGMAGIHVLLGPFHHGQGYKLFAPFTGGSRFLMTSGFAWGAYGAMLMLSLVFLVDLTSAMGTLAVAAGLSVICQALLFVAVERHFSADAEPLFGDINAEGALSVVLFAAAVLFTYIFNNIAEFTDARSSVPVIVTAVAMVIAVPVALNSLHKSQFQWRRHYEDEDTETFSNVPFIAAEHTLLTITMALPFLALYAVHFAMYSYHSGVQIAVQLARVTWATVQIGVAIILVSRTVEKQLPECVQRLRQMIVCFTLYSVPTIIVIFSYTLPVLHPQPASIIFVVSIVSFTLAANDVLRRIIQAGLCVYMGITVYSHGHAALRLSTSGDNGGAVRHLMVLAEDVGCIMFWLLYSRSFFRRPEITGSQYSARFSAFMQRWVIDDVCAYFSFRIIAEPKAKNLLGKTAGAGSSGGRYIMLFHPHGIFPGTAMWAPHSKAWRQVLGAKVKAFTHAATILFNGPIQRDLILGLGGRVVSRKSIVHSLREGNSAIIVPGGQAEMIFSRVSSTEMHLVQHHVGFLRIALAEQVPVVPMLCFNEANVLDNVHCPSVQRAFLKRIGFGFPVVPFGRWYLPLPSTSPLTLVVGDPIPPPRAPLGTESDALITEMKKMYFTALQELFDKHKAACGYPKMRLVLYDKD